MTRAIILSRDAALDIEDARRWLRQPGSGRRAAERLHHIRTTIHELRQSPVLWPVGDHPGVREASAGGYRILYEVEPDTGDNLTAGDVMVLRVFGPGQDRTNLSR